ncbi:MAG: hypothetical protein B6244_02925 [Candidatus Cloacimonetes bacterium 4572_55]|nr:MAG: hypothetical protein B6244_02925 [Candidatus Cloacimonetes bacterium 4572_55]
MKKCNYWIDKLGLTPHPEGGYYKETYRSDEVFSRSALPDRYCGDRVFSTAILFLLKSGQCSHFHRLQTDEIWHYHAGSPLTLHLIAPDDSYTALGLGADPDNGLAFQRVIKRGSWFGATVSASCKRSDTFSLVGCTLSPGFDFADFELCDREDLIRQFPAHQEIILKLTRPPAG